MKKPRADPVLLNLPPAQQTHLIDWLLQGLSYAQAQQKMAQEFNVHVSLKAFSRYYHAICLPILQDHRKMLAHTTRLLAADQEVSSDQMHTVALDALQQRVMGLALSSETPANQLTAVFRCLFMAQDRQLRQKTFDLKCRNLALLSPAPVTDNHDPTLNPNPNPIGSNSK
jgi:hypothetical protein